MEAKPLKYGLFLKRRFCPIFLATFLGALNDNLLRSGLVVLIAYSKTKGIALPARPEILVTICSALLMLPLILFSSIAGSLADKYEKSRLVRYAKIAEVGIMGCAFYGFLYQNIMLLMGLLFISGIHTAFYSPIKFSILPDHLHHKELLAANGFMAAGSYMAILFGLIAGGFLIEYPGSAIGYSAIFIALLGLIASFYILPSTVANPHIQIRFNLWQGTKDIIFHASSDKAVLSSILALSWFLVIASVYMTQFANYAQSVVHGNNEVYILFLTVFSIGIALGSLICDTLLKGEISARFTPFAALGISVFTFLLVYTTPVSTSSSLMEASAFIVIPDHWLVLGCMLMVALCGGIYIVPLYAILQSKTAAQYRSRIMAASNLSDSLLMTSASFISAFLLSIGFGILDLFIIIANLNLLVVWYARKISA